MALTFFSVTDPFAKPVNNTFVFGINATGQIVGSYIDSLNKTHGFLYTAGTYVTLDVPGAISTEALGINSSGQIVGIFVDSNLKGHSFLFSNGSFTTIDNPNPAVSDAAPHGIDNRGNIVGDFFDQQVRTYSCDLPMEGFFGLTRPAQP